MPSALGQNYTTSGHNFLVLTSATVNICITIPQKLLSVRFGWNFRHVNWKKINKRWCINFEKYVTMSMLLTVKILDHFSSDRQHLSYDGGLEVRGEIISTVLCCIVY